VVLAPQVVAGKPKKKCYASSPQAESAKTNDIFEDEFQVTINKKLSASNPYH